MRRERVRVILPGRGDTYRGAGAALRIEPRESEEQAPPVSVPADPLRQLDRSAEAVAGYQARERERMAIGAWLCGVGRDADLEGLRHPEHWRIAAVLLAHGDRDLHEAIAACRCAGLPPELVGRETDDGPVGYLAGCVMRYREPWLDPPCSSCAGGGHVCELCGAPVRGHVRVCAGCARGGGDGRGRGAIG